MKDLKITGESFQIKQDFDLNKHIDPEFGIWQNEQEAKKIELLFSKDINTYILERTWHVNQECRQNDDGSVYLSYMTNQMQETFYWILSLGSKVKVLNPPELIERIKKETSLLAELYKD